MKSTLTVRKGGEVRKLPFDAPDTLAHVLEKGDAGVRKPCGGHGSCGKCAAELTGCVSAPNERENFFGVRLACQAVLLGDAEVFLRETTHMEQIELGSAVPDEISDPATGGSALSGSGGSGFVRKPDPATGGSALSGSGGSDFVGKPDPATGGSALSGSGGSGFAGKPGPMPGKLGAAVDIGTTTLAVRLCDLAEGRVIGELGAENPQSLFAADVMGRISAALAGDAGILREKVSDGLKVMIGRVLKAAGRSGEQVDSLVVAGNTTMLYLLTGQDVTCLSRAPFCADRLFDEELGLLGGHAYLPPCMSAFVGADTACAVLASGLCRGTDAGMLCDIGTNGEIALWKDGTLYVTSTAAGPAFEGAGISCGCGSIRGAIDRVWTEDGTLRFHTIGDAEPAGLCGSGLVDALAAFLELGVLDETGAIAEESLTLAPGVKLTRADIRAAQLAKAAVAAGIESLLKVSGTAPDQLSVLYIAGGFGGHIGVPGAVGIGLIPAALGAKVRFLGNAALAGAERLLLDRDSRTEIRKIAAAARPVNLGGDPEFNESFIDHLYFGSCPADTGRGDPA